MKTQIFKQESTMSNKSKILEMINLQDDLNSKLDVNWRESNQPWNIAAWIECAELVDHIGWKWWKKQETNLEQAKLELVDIWHFIMSMWMSNLNSLSSDYALSSDYDLSVVISDSFEDNESYSKTPSNGYSFSQEEILSEVQDLIRKLINGDIYVIDNFLRCMLVLNLSLDELYVTYIGKNALNLLRKNKGYKEGTYHKTWDGREDNEHLTEILEAHLENSDSDSGTLLSKLYISLQKRYESLNN